MARQSSKFNTLSKKYIQTQLDYSNPLIKIQQDLHNEERIFSQYMNDPIGYARDVLGVYWWKKQREAAESMIKNNKVLVRSSHLVGKSFLGGGLINWAFDTHMPLSGVVTAPTISLVKDVVFTEARKQRKTHDAWRGPSAPVLQDKEDHVVRGVVPNDPTSIHGRHSENVFLLVDEATGVNAEIFEALESLYEGNKAYWICFYNPTDASAMVHHLEGMPGWDLITISALEHPNVQYAIQNPDDTRLPIPGAITLRRFRELIKQWSIPIEKEMSIVTDICLPNEKGEEEWYRPGPIAEARLLARWPTQSYNSIWSDSLFDSIANIVYPTEFKEYLVELACDPARFGDDSTGIMAKCGPVVLELEEYNGLDQVEITNLLKLKADQYAQMNGTEGRYIPIKVDSNGIGAGIVDMLYSYHYNVIDVDVNRKSNEPDKYNTVRSELWFNGVNKCKDGQVTLYKLDNYDKFKLRKELLAPHYKVDTKGRMVVESKDETKKRTKQGSPNLADAFNLLLYDEALNAISVTVVDIERNVQ